MTSTLTLSLAFLIGGVAGLRSMTAPAMIAWAARLGWLRLDGTPLALFDRAWVLWLFTALMLGELVADKLPKTPSRTDPGPFLGRVVMGGIAGAALTAGSGQSLVAGALLGGLGGVAGTLGGYRARTGLVRALGAPDIAIALAEDAVAVGAGLLAVAPFWR